MSRGICLPGADLAFSGLAGRKANMYRLLNGLISRLGRQLEHSPDACDLRWAEVCKVIDLVFVQRNVAAQIDLDLIRGDDAADELCAGAAHSLAHGEDRWNRISW